MFLKDFNINVTIATASDTGSSWIHIPKQLLLLDKCSRDVTVATESWGVWHTNGNPALEFVLVVLVFSPKIRGRGFWRLDAAIGLHTNLLSEEKDVSFSSLRKPRGERLVARRRWGLHPRVWRPGMYCCVNKNRERDERRWKEIKGTKLATSTL